MKITGKTRVVCILGYPVEHSISPYIHNAAFDALGLDYVYVAFPVKPDDIACAVDAMRALSFAGANITIPHKEAVLSLLDGLDPEAERIGAVNTIVNSGGKLVGYNTDSRGYLESRKEETAFEPEGKTIIVLGAGGAARAIVYGLAEKGARRIVIANRTVERAERLGEELSKAYPATEFIATGLDIDAHRAECSLLVNTTSVGMEGVGGLIVSPEGLPADAIVSDIVYKPLDTPLIREAQRLGLKFHRGLGMLVHQAALSFELWTGKRPSIETMKFAAVQSMEAL